jgi:hypothetical protein
VLDPMTLEDARASLREMGQLLAELEAKPEVIREASDAIARDDPARFKKALRTGLSDFHPSQKTCDAKIRTVYVLLAPGHQECRWVAGGRHGTVEPLTGNGAQLSKVTADQMLKHMIELGYVECEWVPADVMKVKVFVNGVCPW